MMIACQWNPRWVTKANVNKIQGKSVTFSTIFFFTFYQNTCAESLLKQNNTNQQLKTF